MPIKTACPGCDKAYTLADTMDGKSVKCKECGNTFAVRGAANGVAVRPSNGAVKTNPSATAKAVRPAARGAAAAAAPKKGGGLVKVLLIGFGLVAVRMLVR